MKHIFIGIDGTWRAAFDDRFHSNVYRLNLSLAYRDRTEDSNSQLFIYGAGVGTGGLGNRFTGGAFGEGLDEVILGSYINLVFNYEPDDKIYLFGFSRGAVAVRALSGLLSASGLVKAESSPMIEFAWRHFIGEKVPFDWNAQRAELTHDVEIEFIGVWDTVSGMNPNRASKSTLFNRLRFRSLDLPRRVRNAVHVIAIDETRRRFRPVLWHKSDPTQYLQQIWIPGVHTDIGGGYKLNFLSTIALVAIIDKLHERCGTIGFDEGYITGTLLRDVEEQDVVVHNEFRDWLYTYDLGYRRSVEQRHANQYLHPLTSIMRGLEIGFKEEPRTRYSPSFSFRKGVALQTVTFADDSFHSTNVLPSLSRKFQSMRPFEPEDVKTAGGEPEPPKAD